MAGGCFNDGTIDIELGEHVFAVPELERPVVRLAPHDAAGVLLDTGGGLLRLDLVGQRVRANLGDAERYVYEKLRALALSEPGTLCFRDNRGHDATFAQAVCIGASGEVEAFRFADVRYEFVCGEKSSEPSALTCPAAPGTYAGTETLQDYAAGGVAIGDYGERMRIEMTRAYPLRAVPRARGARARGPASGAEMRLVVTACVVADVHLATYLEDLERSIGPRPVDLVANGNVYRDVLLVSLRPDLTDEKHTRFEAEFVQEVGAGVSCAGTTTAAATTTTGAPAPACPDAAYCEGSCASNCYCDDFAGVACGGGSPCSGTASWSRSSGCTWALDSPAGSCVCSDITCSGGYWTFTMTAQGPTPHSCTYRKAATASSCPAGTYSKSSGDCADCPSEVTVYT